MEMQIYTGCGYVGSEEPQPTKPTEKIKPFLPKGFSPKEVIITDDDINRIKAMADKHGILLPTQLNGFNSRKP